MGPSYGAPQIRTLKSQTGTGSDRDINFLSGGLAAQDKAAFDISHGGTDFSPWSTYGSGAYRKFASVVASAVGSSGTGSGSTETVGGGGGSGGPFQRSAQLVAVERAQRRGEYGDVGRDELGPLRRARDRARSGRGAGRRRAHPRWAPTGSRRRRFTRKSRKR